MRYYIIESEVYEGDTYRLIYDKKYNHFAVVQRLDKRANRWRNVSYVDENFYVYYPAFAFRIRESDKLPNWK